MVQASTAHVAGGAQRSLSSTAGGPPEAAGAQLLEERPDQGQDAELDDEEDFEMAGEAEEPDDEATLEEEEVSPSASARTAIFWQHMHTRPEGRNAQKQSLCPSEHRFLQGR